MKTRQKLKPGQKGTKALVVHYGVRLAACGTAMTRQAAHAQSSGVSEASRRVSKEFAKDETFRQAVEKLRQGIRETCSFDTIIYPLSIEAPKLYNHNYIRIFVRNFDKSKIFSAKEDSNECH